MTAFINGMGVRVVTIFDAHSRRRRNDVNYTERKAFRVCIPEDDLPKLLDSAQWPEEISISKWYRKSERRPGATRAATTTAAVPTTLMAASATATSGSDLMDTQYNGDTASVGHHLSDDDVDNEETIVMNSTIVNNNDIAA